LRAKTLLISKGGLASSESSSSYPISKPQRQQKKKDKENKDSSHSSDSAGH